MKLQILAACAALVTLSAGSAFAEPITAKLSAPIAGKTKLIAGGAMFVCEADACVAVGATPQTFGPTACKTIADKVGPVTAFGGRRSLDDAALASCNAKAVAKADQGTQMAKQ